jgi:CubicO group peptidase (beta-lactamase class C family)
MKIFTSILLILTITTSVKAQNNEIDIFVENEMLIRHIPGLSACMVKGQQVVWSGAYGTANFEQFTPVTTQTLFTIASLSKLIAGTAVVQLFENGQIDLDDDINDYLDFDVNNPNFPYSAITFRMLLQHRSSLIDPESAIYETMVLGDSPIDLGQYLEDNLSVNGTNYHPEYYSSYNAPGEAIWYSNFGFSLLGFLVGEISGMEYPDYCREFIFDPLCMEETSFFFSEIDTNNVAMPYAYYSGEYVPFGYYSIALYPSALLKTNVEELSRFLIAYTGRGTMDDVSIFSQASADLLTPFSFEEDNLAWWNGLTWTYTFHFPNDEVWYHGGYMPGIRTRINYYPEDSTGLIILTNGQGQYGYIEEEFANNFLALLSTTGPDTLHCHTSNTQNISLESGYQFVSTNIIPDEPDMSVICNKILNNLDFVRNSTGNMLRKIGPNWVNNIGNWITTEGYLFKMNEADDIEVFGVKIDPQTPVSLNSGYQFISYLPDNSMDAFVAFTNIIDNLDFVRNSTGNMLRKIGPNWINGIGDMIPCEGYLVKMNESDILIYPVSN